MVTVLSEHRFPRRWWRQLSNVALTVGLMIIGLAVVLQMIIAFTAGLPLLLGTAAFTVLLSVPILLQTVLHPELSVCAEGLIVHPLIWPAQFVAWDALTATAEHTLISNNAATGKLLYGRNYRPREGLVITVSNAARLGMLYRLVGLIVGVAGSAFAISSTTHTDYAQLQAVITARLGHPNGSSSNRK